MLVLLSTEKLIKNSVVQGNVDAKILEVTIDEVQVYYIRKILGQKLYDDIQLGNWNADYTKLVNDYIQPTMIQYCLFELPFSMNYKFFNKSVGTQDAENMQPADLEELTRITNARRNKAESYAQELTNFLIDNNTKYPLYECAIRNNFTSGMNLNRDPYEKLPSKYDVDPGKYKYNNYWRYN